ncbi:MAG: S8 family serine peptidase, partial [Euzebyales bacterium]|nr:S8 family serine peptidase [Euzebyales bacterium]
AEAAAHRRTLASARARYQRWLSRNVPQARVTAAYDTVLNGVAVRLHGADRAALAGGPGVRRVLTPTVMRPTMDASLEIIDWRQATGQNFETAGSDVGRDVRVGVIDSGIDASHPFFRVDDANRAYFVKADGSCIEPRQGNPEYTSCKVPIAKAYPGSQDARAVDSHGTHVAGTTGGVSGTQSNTGLMSGVAPAAILGNYNVFPGTTASATSEDIAVAVEDAVEDGMDVLNLSLGGEPEARGYDVLELALRGAADVGVLSAVAAGNSGPGESTVQSPGRAPWVLTAGASTNSHYLGQAVTDTERGATYGAAVGEFPPFPDPAQPYTLQDTDSIGCSAFPAGSLSGNVALIDRGSCTFSTKVLNAENAGAVGVVVRNNVAGDPIAMAKDGVNETTVPAVMVSITAGAALRDSAGADNRLAITAGGPISEQQGVADFLAGFSSRGPADTPDGLTLKPDMTSVGVNVNSSVPCTTAEDGTRSCGFEFFQGTSMATPHLAGGAAAIMAERGYLGAFANRDELVKSMQVNNAAARVLTSSDGRREAFIIESGSGRHDLADAYGANFYASPVSLSFGQLRGTRPTSRSTLLFGRFEGAKATVDPQTGVTGATVTAAVSGDRLTVTVQRSGGAKGDVQGWVVLTRRGQEIRVPYWGRF